MKIIDGKVLAEKIKDDIAARIFDLKGLRPNLAIIIVGEREDSKLYVSLKEREGKRVGVDVHVYRLEETFPQADLIEVISFLNNDPMIDGILVQLPLPAHLDTDAVILAIDPTKDVDGFRAGHPDFVSSPVVGAVRACLDSIGGDFFGQKACLMYNSEAFAKEMKPALEKQGLALSLCQGLDNPANLAALAESDIVVSALGRPRAITGEMIKKGSVLIDIGITKVEGKVYGDFDRETVEEKAAWLTPVPGGIGPLTVACLLKNVLAIFENKQKKG